MGSQTLPFAIGAALRFMQDRFTQAGIADPGLDARLLLEWATGRDRLAVLSNPAAVLTAEEISQLSIALDERVAGRPAHRIIGSRGFYGLDFELSPETLEPRADTECLVELALKYLTPRKTENLSILDLGTGTGIIAVSLLANLPNARALAVDASEGALATASRNAAENGVEARFSSLRSNWFEQVEGLFDLVVSNPPYIKSDEIAGLSKEVRAHDPLLALDGGSDGLQAYKLIAGGAARCLAPSGFVGLEIGFNQASEVQQIFQSAGFRLTEASRDLSGHIRALIFAPDERFQPH